MPFFSTRPADLVETAKRRFTSEAPQFVCQSCNALLELYKDRNRAITFKSNATVDKLKSLQAKQVTAWDADDLSYVLQFYKQSAQFKHSLQSEIMEIEKREKLKKLRIRQKSRDSIMNPERSTESAERRRQYQLEFRRQIEEI